MKPIISARAVGGSTVSELRSSCVAGKRAPRAICKAESSKGQVIPGAEAQVAVGNHNAYLGKPSGQELYAAVAAGVVHHADRVREAATGGKERIQAVGNESAGIVVYDDNCKIKRLSGRNALGRRARSQWGPAANRSFPSILTTVYEREPALSDSSLPVAGKLHSACAMQPAHDQSA